VYSNITQFIISIFCTLLTVSSDEGDSGTGLSEAPQVKGDMFSDDQEVNEEELSRCENRFGNLDLYCEEKMFGNLFVS
jgi:hypothetical protein